MRIFLSYGHDRNTPIALRIKSDLEAAGHVVWVDTSEIKAGDDWRRSIVDGLMGSELTLSFLSRHSVRSPGVCLDEIAIALHVRSVRIATVLVEAEAEVDVPVSVSHLQWLDMHDWAERLADGTDAGEDWYRSKLDAIFTVLNDPKAQRFAGEIERLDGLLRPTSQEAEIGALVDGFVGREWLRSAVDDWRAIGEDSRLFWISGAPGTGKSAFAAWLAHKGQLEVIGVNFCRYDIEERSDPCRVLRTLAFQIASRLPDFRRLLLDRLHDPDELDQMSVAGLFDTLLVQPLGFAINGGRLGEPYLLIIDALDETIRDGRSVLTEVLAQYVGRLPDWLRIVVTGRPEPSILRQFAGFKPHIIEAESPENLEDLRTYVRSWPAMDSFEAGEIDARVEQIVGASEGNFLYLQMLREAVDVGLMDLAHPDRLPQGLIAFYERWFRVKFPGAADYERVRPVLEVCGAANRPVPEPWLRRILGWSTPEQARALESLGSLLERREGGLTPFHKSLHDWLTDYRKAGPDFVIDVATASQRLISELWRAFEAWAEQCSMDEAWAEINPFCLGELAAQLTTRDADDAARARFIDKLSDPLFVSRLVLIDTDADEDQRRNRRHWYRDYVSKLAKSWPQELDAARLWGIPEVVTEIAWRSMATDRPWWSAVRAWDDMDQSKGSPPGIQVGLNLYREWLEGILLLTTAVDIAVFFAETRPELAVNLPTVLDNRLHEFLETGADKMINYLRGAREYLPERNVSFLRYAVEQAPPGNTLTDANLLADWSNQRWHHWHPE
jgi:TIR domain